MIGIDAVVSTAAALTAVIASLQAASRASYLLRHDHIGVKEGPVILPPPLDDDEFGGNHTTVSQWDLVQVFQQSVELGLLHMEDRDHAEGGVVTRQLAARAMSRRDLEPYSLSPFPKPPLSAEQLDQLVDRYIEDLLREQQQQEGTLVESNPPVTSKLDKILTATTFWFRTSWYQWRTRRYEAKHDVVQDKEDEDEDEDEEMDALVCLSKRTRLQQPPQPHDSTSTIPKSRVVAEITAFAPKTFARLRSHFGISQDDFKRSIFESGSYISFQSNSKGAARVGGVFFFTRDGAYMIKTIKTGEARTFLQMLPKYYKHMKRHSRHSLLTRFCGMYTVKLRDMTGRNKSEEQRYTFVIMNSVFPAEASRFLSETFDLKGSTVGRECSPVEKAEKGPLAVLKDLDLAREVESVKRQSMMPQPNGKQRRPNEHGIHLGPSCKSKLLAQLRKDVAFLQECRVMDYSLLVGVVNMEPPQPTRDDADANHTSTEMRIQPYEDMVKARRGMPIATLFRAVTTPARLLVAPPLFFTRRLWAGVRRTMSTILTYPLPHYGSSACVVDGGALSVLHGTRSGNRAIYYMGLIDFLQPWTARKVAERQLKGMIGFDTSAISCVDPDEYASRFLDFIDAHVS